MDVLHAALVAAVAADALALEEGHLRPRGVALGRLGDRAAGERVEAVRLEVEAELLLVRLEEDVEQRLALRRAVVRHDELPLHLRAQLGGVVPGQRARGNRQREQRDGQQGQDQLRSNHLRWVPPSWAIARTPTRGTAGSIATLPEIIVKLPDGSPLELAAGATGADAAAAIGPRLAKDALGIKVDGELRDLGAELPDGAEIAIVTARSEGADGEDALWLVRHDAAHVLATAVVELWPGTKVSIGPPIDGGFYYDFEFPDGERPSEADLERIEAAMREHIAADEPFERTDVPVAEALERFRAADEPYKVELIEDLVRDQGVETVSLYRNGPFTDLCRGPHTPSTGRIGAFKLNSLAGAYWRGDENRQMLTRIYGTAFHTQKELDRHLELLERARENDHRRLGPELDLFRFREESPGMPFWLPNGTVLLRLIEARGARAAGEGRLRGDQDPAGARRGALAPLRPLGQLPREHVLRRALPARGRPAPLRAQADELPRRLPRVRLQAPLLPRAAAAPGGVRRRLALRARGRPARPAAGARLHPGRRPRLLHARPGARTRSTRSARRSTSSTRASASRRCGSSSRPGRRSRSAPTSSGSGRRRRCARRSSARVATTTSARGRGRSTGRRSTSTSPTRSVARGSSAPASSTSRCPSASSSPTRARTTPSTGR